MSTTSTLSVFKTTEPNQGEVRYFIDSSSTSPAADYIDFITIHTSDCNGVSRLESIENLTSIKIGDTLIKTKNGVKYTNHFHYEIASPGFTGSLEAISGSCTFSELLPLPRLYDFKNNDYNAQFNNAIKPRRGYLTGSTATKTGGVFELDKQRDTIIPANLNAVLNGSAITASFQESNIYSKAWTLPRYEGSKLTSGSLFFNDPALSFTAFKGVKFPILESSSYIRSQSYADLEIRDFYFNPPYNYTKGAYEQGSTTAYPPATQPVYEKIGKEYKRVTKSKVYIPGTEDILVLSDYQVLYEYKPTTSNPGATSGDNMFTVMIETIAQQDYYYYYSGSAGALIGPIELRPNTSDVIKISGSYIPSSNSYAIDIIDSSRNTHAVFSSGQTTLINKTFVTILSSSTAIV